MTVAAGVDVGKANLDVSIAEGPVIRFDNTAKGITKLPQTPEVPGHHRGRVRIHRRLREAAGQPVAEIRGCRCTWLTRTGVRAFAKACGYEAKTDPRDPASSAVPLRPDIPGAGHAGSRPRKGRVAGLAASAPTVRGAACPGTQSLGQGYLAGRRPHPPSAISPGWIRRLRNWTRSTRRPCGRSADLDQQAALYRTVPGVGPLTAAVLVAHLPELGHWDAKALTSLVGLAAPWSRDSGRKRGQRAIRGGAQHSAPRPVPLLLVGGPGRWRTPWFLSQSAPAREGGQCGRGCGDAQASAATKRCGPQGHSLGTAILIDQRLGKLAKWLDIQHGYCCDSG